ncbi:glycosyltransferase N-terminal domain-containing protein [Campylobacter sp. MG1]|uniref:glycosyltransferase N-terminal domain-containing protein n=1 Tax=Campylobacter sp. MG1 TaxID=2976332 RepID=UPI00226CF015|nr:glycosyltransferase N-terminal domain-containing protein [Campylobacter sp. MG1]
MYFLYIVVSIFLYILGLIILIPLSFKKKYNQLYKKFFPFERHNLADIHFHLASYGEVKSLTPLINYYKSKNKNILITVASKTGYNEAKKIVDNTFFLPLEPILFFWLKPAKTLIVFEAEFWLNLLKIYKNHNKQTILLNARIKKNSFKKYYKFRFFYNEIFKNFDFIIAQSYQDYKRLQMLGGENIEVFTNIKLLTNFTPNKKLQKNKEIVLIASTHKGEEEIILSKIDFKFLENKTLILAPRHPERFIEVENLLKNKGIKYFKFSDSENAYLDSNVFLLDTLGELINFYAISDYVILGGSYVPIGGHNFVEPAFFGCKIIAGKFIYSQLAVLDCIENVVISDDINFDNVKPAKIKSKYSFETLVSILDRILNETRKSI